MNFHKHAKAGKNLMPSSDFETLLLTTAAGAEITGLDLSVPLSGNIVDEIREVWLQHGVLFFRDQNLEPKQLLHVAEYFGETMPYPLLKGLEGFPDITVVSKMEHEEANYGGIWHSDTTYLKIPPMASLLYSMEVPEHGGDTLFANQILAFESLSEPMQRLLSGLTAINTAGNPAIVSTRSERIQDSGSGIQAEQFEAEHPAVITHPETGKKALFVNRAHTQGFQELSEKEGKALLDFIFVHQVRTELCCRFKWTPGTLAFWDNRSMQHYPLNDYHGHRRIMHRITLRGEKPFLKLGSE